MKQTPDKSIEEMIEQESKQYGCMNYPDSPYRGMASASYKAGRLKSIEREKNLEEGLRSLIFTSSKLWDEVKPIKDTEFMTVTHPTIEEAKHLLNKTY